MKVKMGLYNHELTIIIGVIIVIRIVCEQGPWPEL